MAPKMTIVKDAGGRGVAGAARVMVERLVKAGKAKSEIRAALLARGTSKSRASQLLKDTKSPHAERAEGQIPQLEFPRPLIGAPARRLRAKQTPLLRAVQPQRGDSILVLREPWLSLILSGAKTLEIRSFRKSPCNVFLSKAGTQTLYGQAHLCQAYPISSNEAWCALRSEHCVPGVERLYKERTHGIPLTHVECIRPVRYKPTPGAQSFAKFVPVAEQV